LRWYLINSLRSAQTQLKIFYQRVYKRYPRLSALVIVFFAACFLLLLVPPLYGLYSAAGGLQTGSGWLWLAYGTPLWAGLAYLLAQLAKKYNQHKVRVNPLTGINQTDPGSKSGCASMLQLLFIYLACVGGCALIGLAINYARGG